MVTTTRTSHLKCGRSAPLPDVIVTAGTPMVGVGTGLSTPYIVIARSERRAKPTAGGSDARNAEYTFFYMSSSQRASWCMRRRANKHVQGRYRP